jgi:hypothetical protein
MFHHTETDYPLQRGLPLETNRATDMKNRLLYWKRQLAPLAMNPFIRSPYALATLLTSAFSSFWIYELVATNLHKLPPQIFLLPLFSDPADQFVSRSIVPYLVLLKNIPVLVLVALALFLSQKSFHYLSQYLLIVAMISDILLFTILYVYISRLI